MKAVIFYFSGTGNTWFISQKLKEELTKNNYKVNCYSIENSTLTNKESLVNLITESHLIIIGYPTYSSNLPLPMQKFINNLPQQHNKNTAVFCTQSLSSSDGAIFIKNQLKSKGYLLQQAIHFVMSNNFYTPLAKLLPAGDYDKIAKRNKKASKKVKYFVSKIIKNEKLTTGDNFICHLIGNSHRKNYSSTIKKFNDVMYVNNKCTNCNLCVNSCPVNNITNKNNSIQINDNCCLCMRCYNFCPTAAINITSKSEDIVKYPRFKGPIKGFEINCLKK